jgi:8-amino-7-oxononanoate synthase
MNQREPKSIQEALTERREAHALRRVVPVTGGIDLCSNDYLGISRKLSSMHLSPPSDYGVMGATGSRLVSGTTRAHEDLESFLAEFHGASSALLFGSGYEANVGLLSSIGTRHDTIIYDELVHASMRDGIRLSAARSYSFRHNNLDDLRHKIAQARGDLFVAVESLYSMDGDTAPLPELCALCEELGAYLVVDEAHATGVYGKRGEGLVQGEGLESRVYARVHTFGKGVGYRGAIVVGSETLREYLVNFARPFIYSTAPDLLTLRYIDHAYRLMAEAHEERAILRQLIDGFRSLREEFPGLSLLESDSPIQGVVLPSNQRVIAAEEALQGAGFFAKAIRSPTVPVGSERIRICLHAYNSLEEVRECLALIDGSLSRGVVNG